MTRHVYRIGQIVPSSNTTMETEVPAFLNAYAAGRDDLEFTFHSARMRMKHVNQAELAAMDQDSHRCAAELSDAPIDIAGYACLVAIMAMGRGYHRQSEKALQQIAAREGQAFPVITSAGALCSELKQAGHKTVSLLMPYADSLAKIVVDYIEHEGIAVRDWRNFNVTDNQEVGRIPSERLLSALDDLNIDGADAVVLSACVQMPSFGALPVARQMLDIPVTSTADCTARSMLRTLGLDPEQDAATQNLEKVVI